MDGRMPIIYYTSVETDGILKSENSDRGMFKWYGAENAKLQIIWDC